MLEGQSFEPAGRLAQFMRIMEDLDRDALAAAIDKGIELLDLLDGDPDIEDDDRAATVMYADGYEGPTEPVVTSDGLPGDPEDAEDGADREPDDDSYGDRAWIEWHCRPSALKRAIHEPAGGGASEDDEPDDEDSCSAADDRIAGNRALGFAGCFIEDADCETAWPERERQPDHMGGGVSGDVCEDAEPWIVPALEMAHSPASGL